MIHAKSLFDVCIVGHAVRDCNIIDGRKRSLPGGVPVYAASLMANIGLRVAVLTRFAVDDVPFFEGVFQHVRVINLGAAKTTEFVNIYSPGGDTRSQQVNVVADTIAPEPALHVGSRIWYFGPLIEDDIDVALYRNARQASERVAVDVQGLTRRLAGNEVVPARSHTLEEVLARTAIVKASQHEAHEITGVEDPIQSTERLLEMGPSEVLVTMGARGSCLGVRGIPARLVAATPVSRIADPTGCGDTFFASYLAARALLCSPGEATERAAVAAARKLERDGPLHAPPPELALRVRGFEAAG